MNSSRPLIGVYVIATRNNSLLLGKRKGTSGAGDWGLPGGHLERMEHLTEGALRELKEETGLEPKSISFLNMINDPREDEGTHYLHIGFLAKDVEGEPALAEPEKCEEWKWFGFDALPENIFMGHQKAINAFFENITVID